MLTRQVWLKMRHLFLIPLTSCLVANPLPSNDAFDLQADNASEAIEQECALTGCHRHPHIFSAKETIAQSGQLFNFIVLAKGEPTPSLSYCGRLPPGVTFEDQGNGMAILQGTPTSAGLFEGMLHAKNEHGEHQQGLKLLICPPAKEPCSHANIPAPYVFVVKPDRKFTIGIQAERDTQGEEPGYIIDAFPKSFSFEDVEGMALITGILQCSEQVSMPITAIGSLGNCSQVLTIFCIE